MAITRTILIDDDGSGTTGTVLNNAERQVMYDQIDAALLVGDAALGAWTAYTPVWKSTAGTVAIGNGQIAGRYLLAGKTVHFVLGMITGSTSAHGTAGIYSWTLPPFAPLQVAGQNSYNFTVGLVGVGGAASLPVASFALAGGEFYLTTSSGGIVGATIPFTWASGCSLAARGTYDIP